MNEAESLRYISLHTDIPVFQVLCDFRDDEAYYLITEYVEGVNMADLSEDEKTVVREELERHLATLKSLRSKRIGGPSGIVIPPYRVMRITERDVWPLRPSDKDEFVFCHNDLSQHNVVVDPEKLSIIAIIDWEYAGFFPPEFEKPIYYRKGPSSAIGDEHDDAAELLEYLTCRIEDHGPNTMSPGVAGGQPQSQLELSSTDGA